jgi:alpha-L-fucosidase
LRDIQFDEYGTWGLRTAAHVSEYQPDIIYFDISGSFSWLWIDNQFNWTDQELLNVVIWTISHETIHGVLAKLFRRKKQLEYKSFRQFDALYGESTQFETCESEMHGVPTRLFESRVNDHRRHTKSLEC